MFIYKKPPRSHAPGEPLLHENHPKPRTRREFIAAGMLSGPAVVMAPAWLAALLAATECKVPASGKGLPFICFDLAGGANLVG